MTEQPTPSPGPIDREIGARSILRIGAGLVVLTVAAYLASWGFYHLLSQREQKLDAPPSPLAEANRPQTVPGPQLQVNPELELAAVRIAEEERLAGWGWIEKSSQIAHVPVARAIEEVAATGELPDFLAQMMAEETP